MRKKADSFVVAADRRKKDEPAPPRTPKEPPKKPTTPTKPHPRPPKPDLTGTGLRKGKR